MINLRIVKDMSPMSQEMRRLLNQFGYNFEPGLCPHGQTWSPNVDVYETVEAFIILAELPGIKPEDIEVVVDRRHVKITGCRNRGEAEPDWHVHHMEIGRGVFARAFRLPTAVNPEEVTAAAENGVLKIVLPKQNPGKTTVEIR